MTPHVAPPSTVLPGTVPPGTVAASTVAPDAVLSNTARSNPVLPGTAPSSPLTASPLGLDATAAEALRAQASAATAPRGPLESRSPPPQPAASAAPSAAARAAMGLGRLPKAPKTVEDTGLPLGFLVELVAKLAYQSGLAQLTELAAALCLPAQVVDTVCAFMRREALVEVGKRGLHDADVRYDLTGQGRLRAAEWLARNAYIGPAPVALDAYAAQVALQSLRHARIDAAGIARAFSGEVVAPELLDQLGTAMNSGRPMMLYGPSGSGKTYLAARLAQVLDDAIAVPHALYVHGEVVHVHDAHWHRPAPLPGLPLAGALDARSRHDTRWLLCQRPVVTSGGELTLDMLELAYDARAGFYTAPPHFKANNGLYIVDDLGRQRVRPQELMNRWIVPMERRVDYLTLKSGGKFEAPFDVTLVFSSNLRPADLADAAFLRRIGHKVHVGPLPEPLYRAVFERVCTAEGVPFAEGAYAHLVHQQHADSGRPLMACYPRDLVHLVSSRAAYLGVPAALSPELMGWAWDTYFAQQEAA